MTRGTGGESYFHLALECARGRARCPGPSASGGRARLLTGSGCSIVHMTVNEIKALLGLEPHPVEGGFYRRTYTSMGSIPLAHGVRALGTAIYYLLEPGTFSEMHMLASDEIFHFYLGDPVEMLQLAEDGSSDVFTLGPELEAGHHVQLVVPAGVWQGTRLVEGGKLALLGCSVTPGFDFEDYRSGSCAELVQKWPEQAERIRELTRR